MSIKIILAIFILALFVSSCNGYVGQSGAIRYERQWIPKFEYVCKGCENFDGCKEPEKFCVEKGLKYIRGLADNQMQLYPKKIVICKYACASEEVLSKLPKRETTVLCKGGDDVVQFGVNEIAMAIYENRIDGQFLIPANSTAGEFKARLSGDFSGNVNVNIWSDYSGGYWGKIEDFKTPPAGSQISNGIITIEYQTKDDLGSYFNHSVNLICTGKILKLGIGS